jgi:hypothetical protein
MVTAPPRSGPRPLTQDRGGFESHPTAAGALAEAGRFPGWTHPAVELGLRHQRRAIVVLAGRATSVPFTEVLTGPERTTTDNTTAAWTCAVPYLRR